MKVTTGALHAGPSPLEHTENSKWAMSTSPRPARLHVCAHPQPEGVSGGAWPSGVMAFVIAWLARWCAKARMAHGTGNMRVALSIVPLRSAEVALSTSCSMAAGAQRQDTQHAHLSRCSPLARHSLDGRQSMPASPWNRGVARVGCGSALQGPVLGEASRDVLLSLSPDTPSVRVLGILLRLAECGKPLVSGLSCVACCWTPS